MGMTRVAVKVSPPAQPDAVAELHMLLDTGAIYTVLPQAVWRPMGLQPLRARSSRSPTGPASRGSSPNAASRSPSIR
jgi:predicted aspartyl protease